MGMYTELVCAFMLKRNVPENVLDTLRYMLTEGGEPPSELPEHPLFNTHLWQIMLLRDSYYFDGKTNSSLDEMTRDFYLTVRCNVENGEEVIEKFIHWMSPYIETCFDLGPKFIGYKRYESNPTPDLIFITGDDENE